MIDKELAAFLQEGLAINIGTRNARLEPNGARVVAVTVDDDGPHLVAYVPDAAAAQVLPDLRGERPGRGGVRAAARRARLPGEGHVRRARAPASEASAPWSRRSGSAFATARR